MDKRDRFIAQIREEARALDLHFHVDYRKGKGGHALIYVGDKLTTLPSREIDPRRQGKSESSSDLRIEIGSCSKLKGSRSVDVSLRCRI